MEGDDFDKLVEDIRKNGVHDPIVLLEGAILDGRNRYRAARAAGRDYYTEEYDGDDPIGFVMSRNLHRRHLDESQRGMVAAKLAQLRQGTNQYKKKMGAEISASSVMSTQSAAKLMNVHRDTVRHAKLVLAAGTPEQIKAVEIGKRAVSTTAKEIRNAVGRPKIKKLRRNEIVSDDRQPAKELNYREKENMRMAEKLVEDERKAIKTLFLKWVHSHGQEWRLEEESSPDFKHLCTKLCVNEDELL
jgi:hypothetical protein